MAVENIDLNSNISLDFIQIKEEVSYAKLLVLQNQGYLQHLQCLSDARYLLSFQNVEFHDTYNSTALAVKETLARLYIIKRNRYVSLQASSTTLFQHIEDFLRSKELFVLYSDDELSIKRLPGSINVQLQLIIKFPDYLNRDTAEKLVVDGNFLPQSYINVFQYMTSLSHFGIVNFPLVSGVISKALMYWSECPELKEIKIVESKVDERDAIFLTVLNTKVSNEINYFDSEKPKNGSLQLTTDINNCHNFKDFYQETLDHFKENVIEKVFMAYALEEQPFLPATSSTLGKSLNYIVNHYNTVKNIHLMGTEIPSFYYSETTSKRLETLKFTKCLIVYKP
ncbi:hypothetical protein G6F42_012948 [Rhizopus arrhizus]|nr:hypothetical protein G6F42_012948 [Rhizopus arrhizus]